MKYLLYIISITSFLLASCTSFVPITGNASAGKTQTGDYSERYIQAYYPMAVEQMERHGIPASITLAQALLEGGAGRSDLVKNAKSGYSNKASFSV